MKRPAPKTPRSKDRVGPAQGAKPAVHSPPADPKPGRLPPSKVDYASLESVLRPAVEYQGYELVDLSWTHEGGRPIFRVSIDRRPGEGYISHDDCANVSREVSALLDVHELLPGAYNLEVSSPGVNRPLKTASDFGRFVGQRAKVRLKDGAGLASPPTADGQESAPRRNFTGAIKAVEAGVVRLGLDDAAEEVSLPIVDVEKANLIYQF